MNPMNEPCDECKKSYNFERCASAHCKTCGKKKLCPECFWTHVCLPHKGRQLHIISNPQWICNVVNNEMDKS